MTHHMRQNIESDCINETKKTKRYTNKTQRRGREKELRTGNKETRESIVVKKLKEDKEDKDT